MTNTTKTKTLSGIENKISSEQVRRFNLNGQWALGRVGNREHARKLRTINARLGKLISQRNAAEAR